MKIRFIVPLLVISFSSSAQVISSNIKEDPNYRTHTINWAMREKTDYQDGENIIRIENTGNKLMQLGYTARLSTVKHGINILRIDASGKEIATNKLENGERQFGPVRAVTTEFRNRIFMLYFKYDDKDSMRLFISEIDRKSLSLINTRFLFSYQQDNVGILKMTRALENPIISSFSPDSTKFLMAYQTPKNELITCVFGEKLEVLRRNISKRGIPEKTALTDAFIENSGNATLVISEDNSSFSTVPLKGIYMQKLDGKEKYQDYSGDEGNGFLLNCHLKNSKDNSKLYLFGDYSGAIGSAGIWTSELESDKLHISKPSYFPYTDELKQSVYKMGFGVKKKGDYGILDVDYQLVEFDNGSFAVCGNPIAREDNRRVYGMGDNTVHGYVIYYAGPLIMAYMDKNRKGKTFSMIRRNQNMSVGSEGIFIPYQDKLIVFYNDYKANLKEGASEDKVNQKGGTIVHELSLAYAVVDNNGVVKERKLLAEGVSRMNCFNTKLYQKRSENKYEVPSESLDKKTDSYKVVEITIN